LKSKNFTATFTSTQSSSYSGLLRLSWDSTNSGRIITGLEMRCASELGSCSAAMGADGDPPLALKRSIDKGMRPNNAGRQVNYLEIYEPDVPADEMQPVLRYGASLFAR